MGIFPQIAGLLGLSASHVTVRTSILADEGYCPLPLTPQIAGLDVRTFLTAPLAENGAIACLLGRFIIY